jgi:hypothetical protein
LRLNCEPIHSGWEIEILHIIWAARCGLSPAPAATGALDNGTPQVHAHVVVANADGTALGGQLLETRVRPTCEVVLTENPQHFQKRIDPESGLAPIRPQAGFRATIGPPAATIC